MPPTDTYERSLIKKGFHYLAGLDEAGRGCLAGPVVAAAVVLDINSHIEGLDDSKRLLPKRRSELLAEIQKRALGIGLGVVMPEEIDKLNILQASLKAMKQAVLRLPLKPDYLLVDGPYPITGLDIPQLCLKHGDALSVSIAAASIIAKVWRDQMMTTYHYLFPVYGFGQNKGYPTSKHKEAIAQYGPCYLHRYSFKLPRYD